MCFHVSPNWHCTVPAFLSNKLSVDYIPYASTSRYGKRQDLKLIMAYCNVKPSNCLRPEIVVQFQSSSVSKNNNGALFSQICIGFHVKCHLFLAILNNTGRQRQGFVNTPDLKRHESPFEGCHSVPRTEIGGRTLMTKLIVTFRNCFANRPKKNN